MHSIKQFPAVALRTILWVSLAGLLGCTTTATTSTSPGIKVSLSGSQEVPPATTAASGTATFVVGADKSVSGSVTVKGVEVAAAHIHVGGAGKNGPVIIPLTRTSDTVLSVPAGAKLTDAQYDNYKAGELYVNVHSAKYKGGEIRGQLKP